MFSIATTWAAFIQMLPEQQGFPSNTWLNRPIDNFGFYGVIHGKSRKTKYPR
jgi:hypothetical protein